MSLTHSRFSLPRAQGFLLLMIDSLSRALYCVFIFTHSQSHTHTHSLPLVLVVVMKAKELKTKISHTHSLILSLACDSSPWVSLSVCLSLPLVCDNQSNSVFVSLLLTQDKDFSCSFSILSYSLSLVRVEHESNV